MLPFTILSASPESCIIPLFFNLLDTCLIQMIKSLMLHPFLLAFYTTSLHCFSHPRFFTWSASMPRMWSVIVYVHFGSTPIAMYACSLGLLNTPLTHFLSVVGTEISSTILTHFRWSRVFLLCYVVRSSLAISDFFFTRMSQISPASTTTEIHLDTFFSCLFARSWPTLYLLQAHDSTRWLRPPLRHVPHPSPCNLQWWVVSFRTCLTCSEVPLVNWVECNILALNDVSAQRGGTVGAVRGLSYY